MNPSARGIIKRLGLIAVIPLALTSCSPPSIDIAACVVGSRLAFAVGDSRSWFFSVKKARPYSIEVYKRFDKAAWATEAPYDLIQDGRHTLPPERSRIVYGEIFQGWTVRTRAMPLVAGADYAVTIVSNGGYGRIDLIAGTPLPSCSDVHLKPR